MTMSLKMCFTSQPLSLELNRQPVEQRLIDRRFANRAEILDGAHDAGAEVAARIGSPSPAR